MTGELEFVSDRGRSSRRCRVAIVQSRLGVEILEGRDCPAVNLSYGILTITGTDGTDNLLVTQKSGTITAQGQTFEAAAVSAS